MNKYFYTFIGAAFMHIALYAYMPPTGVAMPTGINMPQDMPLQPFTTELTNNALPNKPGAAINTEVGAGKQALQGIKIPQHIEPHHVITLFIRYGKKPKKNKMPTGQSLKKALIGSYIRTDPTAGVYATYAGQVDHSNEKGQITFARKDARDEITLVITPLVRPVIIHGQTVEHFVIPSDMPVSWYHMKREKNEEKQHVWQIQKIAPSDPKRIPPTAILILAEPKDLIIEEGLFETEGGPNLILPYIIARKKLALGVNALLLFRVNRYFSPTKHTYEKKPERYLEITTG